MIFFYPHLVLKKSIKYTK